jgi:ATP-dependent Clp protease adaptor protein ClpS
MEETITKKRTDKKEKDSLAWTLILWNDDVNTFDHVIKSLIDICGHTREQAEQCAYLVHTKGKCDIKKGTYDELYYIKQRLNERLLEVTLEQ